MNGIEVKEIELDDLPKHSHWPKKLLGSSFTQKKRDKKHILHEYQINKWGVVLSCLKKYPYLIYDDLLREQGVNPDKSIPFARHDNFFLASARTVMKEYDTLLIETIRRFSPEKLVELGSGLGDKLLRVATILKPNSVYGGEFTDAGVECGRLMAENQHISATFNYFDYNDPATLEKIPEGAVVYTSHSIEQIPQLKHSFIKALIRRKPKIVIHFEPCYNDYNSQTLIGLMRKRYTELNDYNRNLLSLLKEFVAQGNIEIIENQSMIFSDTPLNPTSVIVWKTRSEHIEERGADT